MRPNRRRLRGRAALAARLARVRDIVHNACNGFLLGLLGPEDLLVLANSQYPDSVDAYDPEAIAGDDLVLEAVALDRIEALAPGRRLLDVCCGAGREAIVFARRGLEVTGIDRVAGMIERARARTAAAGLEIRFLHAAIEDLDLDESFDVVYLSPWMYETFPGRRRRVALLARFERHLARGGIAVLSTSVRAEGSHRPTRAHALARVVARLTGGNRDLEPGDRLVGQAFEHRFAPGELAAEAAAAGLEVVAEVVDRGRGLRFHVLARKRP